MKYAIYDAKLDLMVRSQFWSFRECKDYTFIDMNLWNTANWSIRIYQIPVEVPVV